MSTRQKIQALKEELEKVRKTREELRQTWHTNGKDLCKLEEELKKSIKRLEEKNQILILP